MTNIEKLIKEAAKKSTVDSNGKVGRPSRLSRNRVQVILDDDAMMILEILKLRTGISDRSKILNALVKIAGKY